ncbi:MAG: sulfatase [Puniceicoccaceae bacterium]
MRKPHILILFALLSHGFVCLADKPMNVLMIAVDDLNHWVTYTGRNAQTRTPNIHRLAEMGTAFTNAHCTVPACNPSRASLMSGMRASTTGCYTNGDSPWTDFIAEGLGLEHHLKKNGYSTLAAGKIYHSFGIGPGYESGWDEYFKTPKQPSGGADKNEGFHEKVVTKMTDQTLADWDAADYAITQLGRDHDNPFFIACGLFKPHLAWAVPQKYYDMFPLETIDLPPYLENDLDDIPPAGIKMAKPGGDHAKMLKNKRWKKAIQSYLACIAYTDMNIGRILDALEKSRYKDNTLVVLWSDHGWSLGEKQHWRKFALWEETTRTTMVWAVPGLTNPGTICDRPVDYLTIYPTMCDLLGLPTPDHVEGKSIRPLLKDPEAKFNTVAITTHGYMNHTVRTDRWRYIRYADGSEELYDHSNDPYEFTNLARNPEMAKSKARLAKLLPKKNVKPVNAASNGGKK